MVEVLLNMVEVQLNYKLDSIFKWNDTIDACYQHEVGIDDISNLEKKL